MSILSCRYGLAALTKATSKSQSEARERYISVPAVRSRDRKLIPKLCLLIGVSKQIERCDLHVPKLLMWNEGGKAMLTFLPVQIKGSDQYVLQDLQRCYLRINCKGAKLHWKRPVTFLKNKGFTYNHIEDFRNV